MNVKGYDVGFDKADKIMHIADVHIRNYKRHKEYKQVFRKLYKEARKLPKNSLIYLAGDIAHTKTDISPELVQMISDFLNTLANIRPTILIAGNHDANLNNSSRLDTLSPIVENLANDNLYYLRDSGIYNLADCHFVVMSVFEDSENYILADTFDADTKIALYHGPVNSSQTDIGYVVDNPSMTTKMFDGYDMVLLGDIHKRQYLNDEKTIAYAGSLIQQNFGETFENHGYMIWDVEKRVGEYFDIINDFGYYTVEVVDGKPTNLNNIPAKPRLRVRTTNTTEADVKNIVIDLKKKYKVQDVVVLRMDKLSSTKDGTFSGTEIVRDVRDVDYQNNLISDYLENHFDMDPEILKRIQNINRELNKMLDPVDVGRNINWSLKTFDFSNMFSYGEDNFVDFTTSSGTIGIFAANHTGKSALLDSLTFCIFDRCSRSRHGMDVMNNKKKTFYCKLNFEIDGIDYFIERRGKKFKNGGVRVDTDFWMIDESGEKVVLNGEQRKDTNKNIRGYLGTYDDFILTSLSVQNNNTGFIDKTQTEKKDLLAQFMDITVFEELYYLATEEIKDVAAVLKEFKNTDFESQLLDAEENLKSSKVIYEQLKLESDKCKRSIGRLNERLLSANRELVHIIDGLRPIGELKSERSMLNKQLTEETKKLNKYEKYTSDNKKEYTDLISFFNTLDKEKLTKDISDHQQYTTKKSSVENEIEKLKIIVKNKLDLISKLDTHEYDPNCNYCCNNEFVKAANKAKKELVVDKSNARSLIERGKILDEKIANLQPAIKLNNEVTVKKERLNTITQYQNEIRVKKARRETERASIQHKIDKVETLIEQYYKNETDVKKNQAVNKRIDLINEKLFDENANLQNRLESLQDKYSDIKVSEDQISRIKNSIIEAGELEKRYKAYEYYLNAIERDGVPYELISTLMPYVEDEVNTILSQLVDFNILFTLDGKNINTHIAYDDDNVWPLELTSGMEKFISSLAIRVALSNISNLPRPNLLAIDEGFGNLDSNNINSLYVLFDYLKTQFDFILVISHIDAMKDIMDNLIQISKVGDYSAIKY